MPNTIEDKKPCSKEALAYLQDAYDAMTRCMESVTRLGVQVRNLPNTLNTVTMTDAIERALDVRKTMQKDMDEVSGIMMSPPDNYSTSDVKALLKKSSKAFSLLLGLEKDSITWSK